MPDLFDACASDVEFMEFEMFSRSVKSRSHVARNRGRNHVLSLRHFSRLMANEVCVACTSPQQGVTGFK
jgi:hypothetical protein